MSSPTRIFKISKLIDDSSERFDDSGEIRRLRRFPRQNLMIPTTLTSNEIWRRLQAQTNRTISLHERVTKRRTQLSPIIVSNMIQSRGEVLINHDLPIAGNSNPFEIQDEVLITNDLPIAGSRNLCQRGTQKSPLIMSNMIQTQDEISSTHDSPIAGSSNVFERGTKTHPKTEWNSIQRVDEVSGIQHTRIRDSRISPSSGLVSNKRGLDSMGLVLYGSGKSKLTSFSSRRGRESMG
ncbi:hypothetical protein YC2023_118361 [Brassica napus]